MSKHLSAIIYYGQLQQQMVGPNHHFQKTY